MSQDLIAEPELLPPIALPALARPTTGAAKAIFLGAALLAVAGVWRAGSTSTMLASRPVAVAAETPTRPIPAAAMAGPPIQAAAGEPAALTPPVDGRSPGAAPLVAEAGQ